MLSLFDILIKVDHQQQGNDDKYFCQKTNDEIVCIQNFRLRKCIQNEG